MARTPSFDHDSVIRAARTLFWASGYDNTSVPDLERATGLSRSSLYNTFGSKRGLYDAAVQSYLDEIVRPRLAPLTAATVPADAVLTYLVGLRDAFLRPDSLPSGNGCLLVNSAGAPIAQDERAARVIAAYHAELQSALARGISARQPAAEPERVSLLADTVAGLVIAAFALVRVDSSQAVRSIDAALELLGEELASSGSRRARA